MLANEFGNNERAESSFEKYLHPIGGVKVKLSSVGLYGLPDDFVAHNSTMAFNYAVKFMSFAIDKGAGVVQREKTEEELYLEELERLNKVQKKKKGEENPPEVIAKLEEFKQKREAEELELENMEPNERLWAISEDVKKKPFLRFKLPDPNEITEKPGQGSKGGAADKGTKNALQTKETVKELSKEQTKDGQAGAGPGETSIEESVPLDTYVFELVERNYLGRRQSCNI